MRRTPILLQVMMMVALWAVPAGAANDFYDRDALAEILTLDEQAPLADAEEELAMAEEDLSDAEAVRDTAQGELDSANVVLAEAEADLVLANEALVAAEGAKTLADAAVVVSEAAVTDAEADVAAAQEALANATTPEEEQAGRGADDADRRGHEHGVAQVVGPVPGNGRRQGQ